jgi:ornithine cyclodeaminase/alanine dehydrogenase-like protein (mu-crystallin family)
LSAELEINVEAIPLEKRDEVIREADIVITVTTGNQVLVERECLKQGVFLAKLGSYTEIEQDVITRAGKVVVDNWGYVSTRIPELKGLIKENAFNRSDVHAEWPDIVAGRKKGRETPDENIIYIALGIFGEYAAILPEVYRKAVSMGLGLDIPNSQIVSRG